MLPSPQKQWLAIAWKAVTAGEREALKDFDVRKAAKFGFKAHHEIVTKADLDTNTAVMRVLTKLTPNIPILSEEGGTIDIKQGLSADLAWVLDPIDGTTNYTARLPLWGISLALIRDGEPILGCISLPAMKQRYHAVLGHGSWMGSTRLAVSKAKKIEETVGFLCYGYGERDKKLGLKAHKALSEASRSTRRLGVATLEATWIAAGRADYSVMHGIKPWDVAAGSLIVREAGGDVVTPTGKTWRLGQPDIVYSAPGVTRSIIKHLA
jgi:myo-inositol-1(or 4)-monophosphatase